MASDPISVDAIIGTTAQQDVAATPEFAAGLRVGSVYDYSSHMERTTISRLKARLSAYLRKVRAGQTILVLDRDEPVARLEPVNATRRDPGFADDRLTRLERAGVLRRGRRRLSVAALRKPAPRARASVLEALLEERREGR